MSIIDMLNHVPSCFYSVFTYETDSIENTSAVYDEVFSSCCGFYHFKKDKNLIENSLKTLHTSENNLYGTISFDDKESIRIVSFKNNKDKIINCIFIVHNTILEAAGYSGTTESVLYTNGQIYKRKTQKEFNIYSDIDIGSYQLTKDETELKQLILI